MAPERDTAAADAVAALLFSAVGHAVDTSDPAAVQAALDSVNASIASADRVDRATALATFSLCAAFSLSAAARATSASSDAEKEMRVSPPFVRDRSAGHGQRAVPPSFLAGASFAVEGVVCFAQPNSTAASSTCSLARHHRL